VCGCHDEFDAWVVPRRRGPYPDNRFLTARERENEYQLWAWCRIWSKDKQLAWSKDKQLAAQEEDQAAQEAEAKEQNAR
jgi:hypothetical protein